MTGLAFICGIVVLFIGVLAYETEDGALRLKDSQRGLWTWLTSDNWPAKVGAALMVLGIGALLKMAGLAPSTSEANRLIDGGGVRVDSGVVSDKGLKLGAGVFVVQVGKRKFARITLTA